MQSRAVGIVTMSSDPTASAAWLATHFGFAINVDLGWYVNTQHPDHPNLHLDLVRLGHESMPQAVRHTPGGLVALLVDNVDAEAERLHDSGLEMLLPPTTEPWGQRRFQVSGPDFLVVEVLQQVAPDPQWMAEQGLGAPE